MFKNEFCERFGLDYPIIQAPMAGVSNPVLATAVYKAGALASLGCGAMGAITLDKNIAEFMSLSGQAKDPLININFFSHQEEQVDVLANQAWIEQLRSLFEQFDAQVPTSLEVIFQSLLNDDERVKVILERRPQIVSFHFGLPSESVLQQLKDTGIAIFASACDLNEAKQLEAAGVDYIVAQGYEAGGHRGIFDPNMDPQLGTLELVKFITKECKAPVIAAGGIMNGLGIREVLEQGAVAAQLGTAFILCPESSASEAYRRQIKIQANKANPETCVSSLISGRPARGLVTKLSELGAKLTLVEGLKQPVYPVLYDVNKQLSDAALKHGEEGYGPYWSGTGLADIREMPAAELVAILVKEAFE